MEEIGPNEGGNELLLLDVEGVGGEVNEVRECDVTAWLLYDGLSNKACWVKAVTRSWTQRSPYALVSTKTFVCTPWFVADV